MIATILQEWMVIFGLGRIKKPKKIYRDILLAYLVVLMIEGPKMKMMEIVLLYWSLSSDN